MGWVPFENNDAKTWEKLRDLVRLFLDELYQKGAFAGGKPEEAYYVKCDDESNPPEAVERGILTCEVGVAPAIPAEFLMIQLVQNVGGDR
jgi:phage tail sheath protein FI